jgi:hypothetical protein
MVRRNAREGGGNDALGVLREDVEHRLRVLAMSQSV